MNQRNRRYGYVRVSTKEQNEDEQLLAMQQIGIPAACLFTDKQSGKDFDRPAYRRLLHVLREGDILVVKSIDRLGRIQKRSSNSGAASPRKSKQTSR